MISEMKNYPTRFINYVLRILLIIILLNACSTNLVSTTNNVIEPDETIKIAVLTPFGAQEKKLSYIGKSLRDAALLAKQDLGNLNLQLKIYDTEGREDISIDSVHSAINDGAHIIVGPFLPETTKAISTISKSKGIKVISFSNDLTLAGNNIFVIGDTSVNRAEKLIKYSLEQKKYRFGIISSINNKYNELENSIRDKVSRNGGIETFSINYTQELENLSEIAREAREKAINTNTDAIIFTDDPNKKISLLAAELQDITNSTEKGKIQIIGLSRWDLSSSILSESSLQGSWIAIPDTRFRAIYEKRFVKKFGYRPHVKSSLAYDAIAVVGALIRKRDVEQNYNPFNTNEIVNSNGFIGIDGIFRFKSDQTTEKELAIATIERNQPNILKLSPNKFP
jgi:ABC-type branched-subunit amino acid transport system substrate-binding protein